MSVKTYRRGVILICAALCGALTASLNIWSIFQKPLMEAYGFSPQSVSFAYTIVIAMIGLSGPIGGWLQRKAPAHIIMTVAGIGFGLGWFLTGFASTIPVLYISFGLLVGVCDGICYNLALAIATRWYPDKRGFANGVALAIMAIYPLFTAPMGNMIIENFNVSIAFNIVGVFCIVGFIVLSRFLKMPAADFKPEGWNPPAESDTKRVKNYTSGQMLKTPFFWTLLLFFGTVACTGCVMLSTVSLVGQVQAGMDAATGALMVGIFAIANGTGRLGLGAISDKLGRFQTMFVAVAVTAVIHLFLFANATSTAIFIVEACILGICFGGIMAIMPSVCADAYGPGNAGQNYGFMFIGYTLASFIGPVVSANALATTGSYSSAFPFLGALCIEDRTERWLRRRTTVCSAPTSRSAFIMSAMMVCSIF